MTNSNFSDDLDSIVNEYHELMQGTEKSVSLETEDKVVINKIEQEYPNNLIYYGPPGTGKTYTSMEAAVEICDGSAPTSRQELVARFKKLGAETRIAFVTFHQSYSYEDFVEGIRPKLIEAGDGSEASTEIQYECKPGIFKNICSIAAASHVVSEETYDFNETSNRIWKISLGNTLKADDASIYEDCIENNRIAIGFAAFDLSTCSNREEIEKKFRSERPEISDYSYRVTATNILKNEIQVGDLIVVSDGNLKFRAIGKVVGEYSFDATAQYKNTRKVEWLIKYEESQPYERILNNRFSQMTLYQLRSKAIKLDAIKKLLTKSPIPAPQNHVLIIDEINRGNIAKIFGELITLLEPDKRIGAENELLASLPYSGKPFGVPNNLFIIGTMNTADRSIALLDTALRRRFEFMELMPDASVIQGSDGLGNIAGPNGERIELRSLLSAINSRIEFMLHRDQTVGHAYFTKISTYQGLCRCLTQQVIPLLQEYFYEDWERIQLVFRDLDISGGPMENQFIKTEELAELEILGMDHEEYEDSIKYTVVNDTEITPSMIKRVYS